MLEKLLRLVAQGGLHSYDELAARLGVPRPLLEMMLEDLARRGYLRPAGDGCAASCAACGRADCGSAGRGPAGCALWVLTAKGAALARS